MAVRPDPETGDEFRAMLRAEIARRGWTLREVQAASDAHWTTVEKILRGVRQPSRPLVVSLAEALELDVNDALLAAGYAPQPGEMRLFMRSMARRWDDVRDRIGELLHEEVRDEPDEQRDQNGGNEDVGAKSESVAAGGAASHASQVRTGVRKASRSK